ncbi:Gfo/Idh/MocA family oxidoreductase [Candidatus Aerophobetes bacterium]|nr:Gfo/Idh/MocA family oxidoreductase [Candidatus Aerophobetes bacterium]
MIRYGIIGCGNVFENFQVRPLMSTEGLKVVGVCDIDEKKVKQVQEKYNIKKGTTNYYDLLGDKEIDVVIINLPQHMHVQPCLDAAKAGKHIYVEKPIATTLEDAKKIINACQQNNVKLCVGHQRRFINVEMKAKELIKQGYLGKIFKVRAIACWYEECEIESRKWLLNFELGGGGPLMRWGIHKTDTLRYLLDQEAIRVYAEADRFVHRREDITVEDNCVSLIRFNEGTIAELEVSNSQYEGGFSRGETIEMWGDKGTLWYQPSTGLMEFYSKKKTNVVNEDSFIKLKLEPDHKEFIRIHRKFIESIEKDLTPPVTGEDGYKALEMVIASYKSAKELKAVSLPIPVKS